MSMGSRGGGGDILQKIVIQLMQQGDINGALDQLRQLQAAQDKLTSTTGAVVSAEKKVEDQVYETGSAYEVLEASMKRATTAQEKEIAAAAWMARQAKELTEALEGLSQHEKTAATATTNLGAAQDKAGKGARSAGDAGGYSAMKWLLLGNAIQDVQYGFAAIVNNIPGIVMSFGGSAGLAGGIGIAAVAAQQLLAHLDDIKKALGTETQSRLVYDLKGLQKVLDEIDAKPIKSKLDYSDYDIARKKLADLTEAQQAFERLKSGKSKVTQEAGKLASEAIIEYGGGDDFTSSADRVARAAAAVSKPDESSVTKAAREKRDETRRQLDKASDPDVIAGLEAALARYNEDFTKAQGEDYKNHLDVTRGKVGRAGEGYSGDIEWLTSLVQANPAAFKAQGAGPGLLPGLMRAAPQDVALRAQQANAQKVAEENASTAKAYQDKVDKKNAEVDEIVEGMQKDAEKYEKEQQADHDRRVKETAGRVGPGFDDALQKGIFDALKGGQGADQAMAGQRGALVGKLGARGVEGDIVGKVADLLLRKAADSALNLIQENGRPKLDVKAQADHDKAVREQVTRVAPGFNDSLEAAVERRIANGQSAEQASAALKGQLQGRLGSRNVPINIQGDVATEILKKVTDAVGNRLATASNPRVAAAEAVIHGEAKDASRFAHEFKTQAGATDAQAEHAGALAAGLYAQGVDASTAMNAVHSAMTGHMENVSSTLRGMINSQENLLQILATASSQIGALQSKVVELDTKIRMQGNNQNRWRIQGQTGQVMFQSGGAVLIGVATALMQVGVAPSQAAEVEWAAKAVPVIVRRLDQLQAQDVRMARNQNRGRPQMGSIMPPFGGR